ncbi:hypothetical protein F4861DRAFT_521080 [Xylaria intraflava]|nr:hypothetical protein F4861DRAFT_521080 [Xylaria intraflava]
MPKSTDQNQMLNPGDPSGGRRPSFSLSSSFQSVKRAVSGRGRKSEKSGGSNGGTGSLAGDLAATNPFADPPPAYTATAAAEGSKQTGSDPAPLASSGRIPSIYTRLRGSANNAGPEDKFRFLAEFDTVFLIDDSSSMTWNDWGRTMLRSGELSRWEQTRNVIEQIVPICMRYDQDGVDIYFLNDPYDLNFFGDPRREEPTWRKDGVIEEGKASHVYAGVSDADAVRKIFNSRRPALYTPTGKRLGQIMETYVDCYEARELEHQARLKPLNIIVITDGEASDKGVLRNNLIRQAERLDALNAPYHQLGVQFIQVGKDAQATSHLHELDDNLGRRGQELRDMVDCVTHEQMSGEGDHPQLTADAVLKIVLGAVNKRLDNLLIRQGSLVES